MDVPWDVYFFVQQRRAQLRRASANAILTVEHRLKLDALKSQCDMNVLSIHEREIDLWTELSHKMPVVDKVDSVGRSLLLHTSKADKCFERMLRINPTSVSIIRRYSKYLTEVKNDPLAGIAAAEKADDIEDMSNKEHAEMSSNIEMLHHWQVSDLRVHTHRCF
jgi:hypothetical protein